MRYESSNELRHKNYKYISRKWVGGQWQYIYPEDVKGGNKPRASYSKLTRNNPSQGTPTGLSKFRIAYGAQKSRVRAAVDRINARPLPGRSTVSKGNPTQGKPGLVGKAKTYMGAQKARNRVAVDKIKNPYKDQAKTAYKSKEAASNVNKKSSITKNNPTQGAPKFAKLKTSINKFKAEAKEVFDKGKAFFGGKKPSEIKLSKASLQGTGPGQKAAGNNLADEAKNKQARAKYEKTFQGQLDKGRDFIENVVNKISNTVNPRKESTSSETDMRLNKVQARIRQQKKDDAAKAAAAERAARDKAIVSAQRKTGVMDNRQNGENSSLARTSAANARNASQNKRNVTDAAVENRLASQTRKAQSDARKAATSMGPRATSTATKPSTTKRSAVSVGGGSNTSTNKTYTTRRNLNPASPRTNVSANTPYATSNAPGDKAAKDRIQRIKDEQKRKRRSGVSKSR